MVGASVQIVVVKFLIQLLVESVSDELVFVFDFSPQKKSAKLGNSGRDSYEKNDSGTGRFGCRCWGSWCVECDGFRKQSIFGKAVKVSSVGLAEEHEAPRLSSHNWSAVF